jgi:hypothetical protein
METPQRLILFLELVRGCNNKECPSWGTVCKYGPERFMEEDVLHYFANEFHGVIEKYNPFQVIDIWCYGCGDSLDHPNLSKMLSLAREYFGKYGKLSMAIDSRRDIPPGRWYTPMDTLKLIHKMPESYDWLSRAKYWDSLEINKSHKVLTNHISKHLWDTWLNNKAWMKEFKAVGWHDIELGSDNPILTQRQPITCDEGLPAIRENYYGRRVRRVMFNWDGSLTRCLVHPTKHKTVHDLILGGDDICNTCFPLTGGELVKFYDDHFTITPSVNCVSDGYFVPIG